MWGNEREKHGIPISLEPFRLRVQISEQALEAEYEQSSGKPGDRDVKRRHDLKSNVVLMT